MPKDDENVAALIREEHANQGHAGTNHVWSTLSQSYWILNGRQTVKNVIQGCIPCQKNFKQPGHQKMADLPADRLDGCAPFEATAIDAFGPFIVKNGGRGGNKRWVLLFTCLSCRAVHFELLRDLSASTFINALVRFHGRRPGLRILYSDKATNFCGGERELKNAVSSWNQSTAGDLLLKGVEWKHSPPLSPHSGGIWERVIKEAKRHLTAILGSQTVDVDVFATALVEVERILNCRPLTYSSSDIRDLSVITPANLLYPGVLMQTSTNVLPPRPLGGEPMRYQWQKARSIIDEFWARWSSEYLKTLQRRPKWQKNQSNLYIGQIVLMIEPNTPRDQWKLARVESVHPEANNVRTANVRTISGKIYERHVTKLVALELE